MVTIAELIEKKEGTLKVDLRTAKNDKAKINLARHALGIKKFAGWNAVMLRRSYMEQQNVVRSSGKKSNGPRHASSGGEDK